MHSNLQVRARREADAAKRALTGRKPGMSANGLDMDDEASGYLLISYATLTPSRSFNSKTLSDPLFWLLSFLDSPKEETPPRELSEAAAAKKAAALQVVEDTADSGDLPVFLTPFLYLYLYLYITFSYHSLTYTYAAFIFVCNNHSLSKCLKVLKAIDIKKMNGDALKEALKVSFPFSSSLFFYKSLHFFVSMYL